MQNTKDTDTVILAAKVDFYGCSVAFEKRRIYVMLAPPYILECPRYARDFDLPSTSSIQ